jgi:hypothetical protein
MAWIRHKPEGDMAELGSIHRWSPGFSRSPKPPRDRTPTQGPNKRYARASPSLGRAAGSCCASASTFSSTER